jgi:hypothetical protein
LIIKDESVIVCLPRPRAAYVLYITDAPFPARIYTRARLTSRLPPDAEHSVHRERFEPRACDLYFESGIAVAAPLLLALAANFCLMTEGPPRTAEASLLYAIYMEDRCLGCESGALTICNARIGAVCRARN